MNTETKQEQNDDMQLTPQQIQLMQQMQQQNNYTDELKDFASKIASQIENEQNEQEEEVQPVMDTPVKQSMVDKILLHAKEPLFVSLIIMVLCISNKSLVTQFGKLMPKLVTGDNLSIIGMLLVSILGGALYFIGKKFVLDKKNII